jgi:hypothetical protein
MFATMVAGLCAFVLENTHEPIELRVPAACYPAVAIGFVGRNNVGSGGLVLAEGRRRLLSRSTNIFTIFRVDTIAETSAILRIDD